MKRLLSWFFNMKNAYHIFSVLYVDTNSWAINLSMGEHSIVLAYHTSHGNYPSMIRTLPHIPSPPIARGLRDTMIMRIDTSY